MSYCNCVTDYSEALHGRAVHKFTCADSSVNPAYPALATATVKKFRALNTQRELDIDETRAYGEAVLIAVRALNKPVGAYKEISTRSTGWTVAKCRAAHSAAIEAGANEDRRRRSDETITAAYEAAMVAKRARIAQEIEATQRIIAQAENNSCNAPETVYNVYIETENTPMTAAVATVTETAMPIANRHFGIELEVIMPRGLSNDLLARSIRAAGIECHAEGYGHSTRPYWKITTDASIAGNGAEIVSPKLIGEAGIRQARIVADAISRAGCKVDKTCGFHVHVDGADLTADQMAKVAVNYLWFETFFDHIMPASRRGSHNEYCISNRSRFGGYGTQALNAGIARINGSKQSISRVIEAVNGTMNRYCKLNLTAHNRHSTVEFRQHSGTIEADKIEHWVRLLVAFVEKSRVSRPRPRSVAREWTASQEMHLFFAMFNISDKTAAYYAARRKQIAKQDAERAAPSRVAVAA